MIFFLLRFKTGRNVEITFVVKNGLNEVVAWHYID